MLDVILEVKRSEVRGQRSEVSTAVRSVRSGVWCVVCGFSTVLAPGTISLIISYRSILNTDSLYGYRDTYRTVHSLQFTLVYSLQLRGNQNRIIKSESDS